MQLRRDIQFAIMGLALATACADPLILETTPEVVRPLWNPADGTLPTPTDLVRDSTSQSLALPIDASMPAAEQEFRRYLNFLDGYPLQSTIRIPMDGDVAESSVSASLFLADRASGQRLPVDIELDASTQTIIAKAEHQDDETGLRPGREYVMALAGYDKGVIGVSGEAVVADAAFYLVRSESRLTDHPGAMPGEDEDAKHRAAEALEELRLEFRPLFETFEGFGVAKHEVAVLSSFTTTALPSVWFDTDVGHLPVPNQVLVDPQSGLVSVPVHSEDDPESAQVKEALNGYDGFATSAAMTISATANIDPNSVNSETVRLYRFEADGTFFREDALDRGLLADGHTLWMKPTLNLEHSTFYAMVVTRQVTAGGKPLEAQPLAALLRSKAPLLEDGAPTVSILTQTSAELLEPLRVKMKPLMDQLEAEGISRSDLAVAVPFRTLSALQRMLDFRAELYTRDVPTGVRNVVVQTPVERGLPVIMRDVETIVSGEVTILDFLDPSTRRFRDGMTPQENSVSFVVTIPEGVTPGQPIPTVLFGHGLLTSRELLYMIANKLAQNGYAAFALDLPYHGKRSVCLGPSDCVDSSCNELGKCVRSNGTPGELATVASPWPDGPEFPATTGSAFVEVDNIVGSRDHFMQAVLDLSQGLRVIRGADWAAASSGYVLDGDDVVYLGMSLGGILGSMFAGVEPTVTDFVLNVPGGNLFQLLTVSDSFQTAFQSVLDRRGIARGTDAFVEFETALRWLLDGVDPMNLAPHATIQPYEYVDPVDGQIRMSPVKRVMIQMAEGDIVVPNAATVSLSERMQVPIRTYTPLISNHAFLFDPTSLEGARARNDAVEFFDAR